MLGRLKAAWPYAALLAGAAYLYHEAGAFAAAARPGQLGPDFWPRAVLVLLMIVCASQLLRHLLLVRPLVPEAPTLPADEEASTAEQRYPWRLAAGIGLSIAYVLSLDELGFFVATVLFLGLFMIAGRYYRARVVWLSSLIGSLVFVFVFMKVVYVSLPLGIGPFRTFSIWLLAMLGVR